MRGMGQRGQHVDVQQVLHSEPASAFSITDKATGFFPGAKGRTSKPLTGSRTRPGNLTWGVVLRLADTRRGLADFFGVVSVGMEKMKARAAKLTSPSTAQNKSNAPPQPNPRPVAKKPLPTDTPRKLAAFSSPASLFVMSTVQEIQDAILHLPPEDREALRHWLDDTEEETPEMLAAIDVGLRSLRDKGVIPLEQVRQNIAAWATKSA